MKGEDLEGYFSVENGTDDTAHQSSASPAALDEDMVTEERWTDQSALLVVDEDIPVDGTKSKKARGRGDGTHYCADITDAAIL